MWGSRRAHVSSVCLVEFSVKVGRHRNEILAVEKILGVSRAPFRECLAWTREDARGVGILRLRRKRALQAFRSAQDDRSSEKSAGSIAPTASSASV
jgi:hypothetical protein